MQKTFLSLVVLGIVMAGMWTSPAMALSFDPKTTLSNKLKGLMEKNSKKAEEGARARLDESIAAQKAKSEDGIKKLTEDAEKDTHRNQAASFGILPADLTDCKTLKCWEEKGPKVAEKLEASAMAAVAATRKKVSEWVEKNVKDKAKGWLKGTIGSITKSDKFQLYKNAASDKLGSASKSITGAFKSEPKLLVSKCMMQANCNSKGQ
jgi:hypothetical protein